MATEPLDPMWIGIVTLDGESAIKLTCPGCGTLGYLDNDQAHGRVSVHCECGWHETHDFWGIAKASKVIEEWLREKREGGGHGD